MRVPNGTTYTFLHENPYGGAHVTKIEDIHGNSIDVEYEPGDQWLGTYLARPRIKTISRSDVPTPIVTFSYYPETNDPTIGAVDVLQSITANGQTWQYFYTHASEAQVPDVSARPLWLTRVERPDGKSWIYEYYDYADNPDSSEQAPEPHANSLQIQRVTHPDGATVEYSYKWIEFDNGTYVSALDTKIVTDTATTSGTWQFDYAPRSIPYQFAGGSSIDIDLTTVTTPNRQYKLAYLGSTGRGQNAEFISRSLVGAEVLREIYDDGKLLERRQKVWGERFISTQPYRPDENTVFNVNTYAPVLLGEYFNRDDDAGNTASGFYNFVEYGDHDAYGNPRTITESIRTESETRTTQVTYKNDESTWIFGLPELVTVRDGVVGSPVYSQTTNMYTVKGQLQNSNVNGVETAFTYHPTGDLHTIEDAEGNVTTLTNYKRGTPQSESYVVAAGDGINPPELVTIDRVVNDTGTVQSVTDGENHTTSYLYDDMNRLQQVTYPKAASAALNITYAANTRTIKRGTFTRTDTLGGLGQLIHSQFPGFAVEYQYDANLRKIFQSYPGQTEGVSFSYDGLDRLVERSFPAGEKITMAYNDNRVDVTNERNHTTEYTFRTLGGNPSEQQLYLTIENRDSAPQKFTRVRYDKIGNVTHIDQGTREAVLPGVSRYTGFSRSYVYDDRFYLESESHPEHNTIHYQTDDLGNVISRGYSTDLATHTVYHYDGLSRLIHINYPNTEDVTIAYYNDSRLHSIEKGSGDTYTRREYSYDDNGNPSTENITIGSNLYTLGYTSNDLDHLMSMTYPSGRTVDYNPDNLGRPRQATPFATSVTSHFTGQFKKIIFANGASTESTLTDRLLINTLNYSSTSIGNLDYDYDDAGNVESLQNSLAPSDPSVFSYTQQHYLKSATGDWGARAISYDTFGNLTQKGDGEYGYLASAGGNIVLNSITDTTLRDFSFDSTNGNMLEVITRASGGNIYHSVNSFDYDDANNLIQGESRAGINPASEVIASLDYLYDGANNRVKRTDQSGIAVDYVFTRGGLLVGEYNPPLYQPGNTAGTKEFFYLGRQQIAAVKENTAPLSAPSYPASGIVAVVGDQVQLDGGESYDPDGRIDSYAWVQIGGITAPLSSNSDASPTFTAPVLPGGTSSTLTYQLIVTDVHGTSSPAATVSVEVNENTDPSAVPQYAALAPNGVAAVLSGDTTYLVGGNSYDINGPIAQYLWQPVSGTSVTLSNANSEVASFIAPTVAADAVDILQFTLTVTDIHGGQDTVQVDVPVYGADYDDDGDEMPDHWEQLYGLDDPEGDADNDGISNLHEFLQSTDPTDQAPTINILLPESATTITEGVQINLSAGATDVEDGDLSTSIVWSSDQPDQIPDGANVAVTLGTGEHTITAAVTDSANATSTDTVVVTVLADSEPDGLPDEWELEHFPDLSENYFDDPDQDGVVNGEEYLQGTDPNDATTSLKILSPTDGAGFASGATIVLNAQAIDVTGTDMSGAIQWSSQPPELVATGASASHTFPDGNYTIVAEYTDTQGQLHTKTLAVSINELACSTVAVGSVNEPLPIKFSSTGHRMYAHISGDGSKIAFIPRIDYSGFDATDGGSVVLIDRESNASRYLSQLGYNIWGGRWMMGHTVSSGELYNRISDDGNMVSELFSLKLPEDTAIVQDTLYYHDLAGTTKAAPVNLQWMQNHEVVDGGHVSGDGEKIAYTARTTTDNSDRVYVLDTANGTVVKYGEALNANFLPSGERVSCNSDCSLLAYLGDDALWLVDTKLNTSLQLLPRLAPLDAGFSGSDIESAELSLDGNAVVFTSSVNGIVSDDTNNAMDVFVYDRLRNSIERVSVSSSGVQGNGDSGSGPLNISVDNRFVVFASDANNLDDLTTDSNGVSDIFIRDILLGTTTLIPLPLQLQGADPLARIVESVDKYGATAMVLARYAGPEGRHYIVRTPQCSVDEEIGILPTIDIAPIGPPPTPFQNPETPAVVTVLEGEPITLMATAHDDVEGPLAPTRGFLNSSNSGGSRQGCSVTKTYLNAPLYNQGVAGTSTVIDFVYESSCSAAARSLQNGSGGTGEVDEDILEQINTHVITYSVRNSRGALNTASYTVRILPDANANGLDDYWELQYGISDPMGDEDGDGISNAQEYSEGSDPTATALALVISSPQDGNTYTTDDLVALIASSNIPDLAGDITWQSDKDGSLGTGPMLSTQLSLDTHVITASIPSYTGETPVWPSIQLTITAPEADSPDTVEPSDNPDEHSTVVQWGASGDLNGDDRLTVVDLLLLEKAVIQGATLTAEQQENADLYPPPEGDDQITIQDLLLLNRRLLHLEGAAP